MKRVFGILLALLLIVGVSGAWGMGCTNPSSGTVTTTSDAEIGSSGVRLLQVSFTTASSGGTFTCVTNNDVTGWILNVETDPGATAPTTLYDVDLDNANGRDIMGGALDDRSATETEDTLALKRGNYQVVYNEGPLTIQVTAAGNSKTVEILITYLP